LPGRKIIRVSNDLLHIIHLDTRANWTGISEHFKIEIALVTVWDKAPFIRGYELTGTKKIEDIVKKIRDHYRITQEYVLLADFLTRKIIDSVIPYFEKYNNSNKILNDRKAFKLGDLAQRNENLILFSELLNRKNLEAEKINDKALASYTSLNSDKLQFDEYFKEIELFKKCLNSKDWTIIEQKLLANKIAVFSKLKIKPVI
jgi:hypothetical protein